MASTHRNAAYGRLREIDQVLLDRIVEMGDDLSQPRHTLLFFYQPKEGRAAFDVVRAAAPEMSLAVAGQDDGGVTIEGTLRVDAASVEAFVSWAIDVASRANAVFDGWECAVIATKH